MDSPTYSNLSKHFWYGLTIKLKWNSINLQLRTKDSHLHNVRCILIFFLWQMCLFRILSSSIFLVEFSPSLAVHTLSQSIFWINRISLKQPGSDNWCHYQQREEISLSESHHSLFSLLNRVMINIQMCFTKHFKYVSGCLYDRR